MSLRALSGYPRTTEITTRWKDNDVYGHVNNVEYYSYFDTAINEYLIAEGGLDIHGGDAIGLCVESGCRFTAPLAFPGRVLAGLRVATLGQSSVRYEIGLFDAAGDQQAAEGYFVHVFVDRASRRPTAIPEPIRAALVRLCVAAPEPEAPLTMSLTHETVFTMEATPVKFGPGASADAGWELARLGVARAMLVTDPGVAALGHVERIAAQITEAGIEAVIYDRARVEPTLDSVSEAAAFAAEHGVDGFVSVGGGSAIDTAKVADLILSHPAPVMEYVNAPVGAGAKPPSPLKPHLAIPTTSGTGSEATTVAVIDIPDLQLKTGISHRYLRPAQAIVDPELTRTLPPQVTASAGLDVVCHAAESFLSRPYDTRARPDSPADRPPYQGSNPVADVWSAKALEFGGRYLRRAVADPEDVEARGFMMLAATMAGVGFGSAGVHLPHACAYPIAGLKHVYQPPGYPDDHPFVPHGHSVIVTAPAAFRFTYDAMPGRHHEVAQWLAGGPVEPGPDALPGVLLALMRDVQAPSGVAELGYTEPDIPALVAGALKQRLLAVAPKHAGEDDLARIITASMHSW